MFLAKHRRAHRATSLVAASAALLGLVGTLALATPAYADDPEDPYTQVLVNLSKSVTQPASGIARAGETVSYGIEVGCASTLADCVGLKISDVIPEPLVLADVVIDNSGIAAVVLDRPNNSFVVSFKDPLGEFPVGTPIFGLQAGVTYNFLVTATVPADVSADWDGVVRTNTAFATLDNVNSNTQDAADVTLDVPQVLASGVTKSFSESEVPSVPGRPVTLTLGASNDSNTGVDALTIEDGTLGAFTYLEVTGASVTAWPADADLVATDWFDGTTWQLGGPAAAPVLPVDPSLIEGLRFTFTSSTGSVIRDATATVVVNTTLRTSVLGITGSVDVVNTATSWVTKGADVTDPASASDTLTITKKEVAPVATKSFSTNSTVGGEPVTVSLGASNGGIFTVNSMTITEPSASSPNLIDQGLTFGAFDQSTVEWPVGATGATIAFQYEGDTDFGTPIPALVRDTLPVPDPTKGKAAGFRIVFTGLMLQGQYAVVKYSATPGPVTVDVSHTNTISVDVTTTDGLQAQATADAALVTRTARINTSVRKIATPGGLYSVAGSSSIVALPGQLDPIPEITDLVGGSTVGAKSLTITDADSDFFDYFDVSKIQPTTVPVGINLVVEYWDGSLDGGGAPVWQQFATNSTATGLANYSRTLSASEQAAVRGIRFIFTPTNPTAELAPGFAVQPNLRVVLRDTLRSNSALPAANPDAPADVVVSNTASSTAVSPSTDPTTVTDEATADLTLFPVPSGPGGIEFIEKEWVDETVNARTADQARALIRWDTANLPFSTVEISDTDAPTIDGAGTTYDAFDLTMVSPITPEMDPQLEYDEVTKVQLYIGGAWVDTAANPCAANACDGTFPGYGLTPAESRDATGVRLVFAESPTRGTRIGTKPAAPPVGTGVAVSSGRERNIGLIFTIRDFRRSTPTVPVLGSSRSALYNAGPLDFGVVVNSARFIGVAPDLTLRTDTDDDTITILDLPLTVAATKAWQGGPFGQPMPGTPLSLYPTGRMTLTAQNTSLARVDHLTLAEPSANVTVNPFEFFTVTDIVSVEVPAGGDAVATVTLLPSGTTFTPAAAEALLPVDLQDVTGITVALDGTVLAAAKIKLVLDTQLRPLSRTGALAIGPQQVDNEVSATIVDAGGSQIPVSGTDNTIVDYDQAHADIQVFDYGVNATKTLIADTTASGSTPATQWADTTKATVRLTGQPTGNVRSTTMVFEDTTPSFWNAYDFSGFPALNFATPINRVQVDVLVGVEYTVGAGNTISSSCPTANCWVTGTRSATPALPAGVLAKDVRGIRFTFTRADYAAWERPFNPLQRMDFTVERREFLVTPADQLVPSTLFTFTQNAPGEPVIGTYNNDVTVQANSALSATDTTPLWFANDADDSSITFAHLPAKVSVSKSLYGPQSLGADLPFDITVKNTGISNSSPLTGLTIVDVLPVDGGGPMVVLPTDPDTGLVVPASTAFTYTLLNASGTPVAAPSVTAVYDNATLPTAITFTLNQPLALGYSLVIRTPLQFRPLLGASLEAENKVTVTADQPFDECRGTVNTQPVDPTTFVFDCTASTTVWPLPSSPMTIVKSVRGIEAGPLDADGNKLIDPATGNPFDDLGVLRTTGTVDCGTPNTVVPGRADLFYRSPCVPITRPGAEEEWAARFYNSGNISIKQLVAMDVLPAANDRGVIIDEARSSKWAAKLSSYPEVTGVPADATYTVYYVDAPNVATPLCNGADIQLTMGMTTATFPPVLDTPQYRNCLDASGAALAVPRNWQVLSPAADATTLASVVAMKFDVRLPTPLAPGASVGILYRTLTANQQELKETNPANLTRDSIAYNSIAGAAVGINVDADGNPLDLAYRFVTEPRKVGVALATGQLKISKEVTGAAKSFATNSFNLQLACTSNGDNVLLTFADGTARNPFAVTAGSTVDVFGVPLYSTCALTEPGNYGAYEVTLPAPTRVLAQLSSSSTVFDPNPAFADRPAVLKATVFNDYPAASLTLTKSITTNGGLDKDGNPIVYKPALASVVCTFDNGTGATTILSVANQQLIPGTPLVFSNLVAGALCTVTENDQRGATTTSVVTTSGSPVTTGGAAPARFTLVPDDNSVAFANDFGAGSLRVNKVIAGPAKDEAWANGPFTVRVICTNPNAVVTEVLNQTVVLTRAAPERLFEHIPTGSSCVTTEPESNGATTTTLPGTIVIDRAEQRATVTNTFNYARLNVRKVVTSNAVDGGGVPVKPGPFDFTVVCTFTHGTAAVPIVETVVNASFQLSHNGTRDFVGLPARTKCVVTEATPIGSPRTTTIRTTTSAGTATVTALTATINSLTSDTSPTVGTNFALITNTYDVGSLRIAKSLNGGGSTQFGGSQTFTFLVTCTSPGVTVPYSKTVSITGSGTTTINNIIAGSTCAVSETNFASTGADARVILNNSNVVFDGTGIAIVRNTTPQVTFQNWYLTGAVTVTKTVAGPGAAFGTGPFMVRLVCTRGGQNVTIAGGADRSLTNGTSTTYTLLPRGATCILTETSRYGAGSMSIQDSNGALDVAGAFTFVVGVDIASLTDNQPQPALGVTNTFQLASLVVSKAVQSAALKQDGSAVTYGDFAMQVTCTFQGTPVRATGFASDTMTFMLADAASRTLAGLPAGAICQVTETNAHGAARTSVTTVSGGGTPVTQPGSTAAVTLVTSAVNSAAVLNEYDTGSLALSKVVDGLARAQYGTGSFTVHVECTLADGASSQVVWSKDYTFTDGSAPFTLSPIAAGASCEISETQTAGATSTTVAFDGVPQGNAPATTVIPANATRAAVVTNTFDYASLAVSKVVESAALDEDGLPVYPGGLFDFEVSCTFLGNVVLADTYTVSPMEFSVPHAGAVTLTKLPAGARCVIDEVNDVQADSTSITITTTAGSSTVDASTATIAALTRDNGGATNTAAVVNRYGVTSFTVEKVLEGAGSAQFGVGPFDIHVVCTAPGGVKAFDDIVSLPIGSEWFKRIDSLPNGSVCTTDEENFDDTGADAQTTVNALGEPVTTTTVTSGEPGFVSVHNWYLSGSVAVTKRVTGDGGDKFGVGPFTVSIECTRGGELVTGLPDATQNFTDGETVTFHGLPSGADCTLTETNSAGASTSAIVFADTGDPVTDGSFTVVVKPTVLEDDQEQRALRVENDFPTTSIVITKNVLSTALDESDNPIAYGPFAVTVSCTFEGVSVYGDDFDEDNVMAKDIAEGTPFTITGLPVGAECEIEETNAMGADATSITTTVGVDVNTAEATSATITLAPDDANLVDIDNTFDVGSVELSKLVSGDGATAWGTEAFELTLECTLTDATGTRNAYTDTFTFRQGDPAVTVSNIAEGARCVITETSTGFATATSIAVGKDDAIDGLSAEFDVTTGTILVQVENRFDVTSVTVEKVRTGDGSTRWGNGPFEVMLMCERGDDLIEIPGGSTRALTAPDYTAEFAGLPVDATCVVSESKFGGANGSVVSPASFTLGADHTAVIITNEFREGALKVQKTITGDGVGIEEWGMGPFEVSLECTRVVNNETVGIIIPGDATRSLEAPDYEATYENLPEGAKCTLTETEDGDATSTTIDPGTVTISGGETTEIAATNTFTVGQLAIVKTASQPVVQADDSFFYTFQVSNTGTVAAAGVTVVDEIPDVLRVTDVTSDGWTDCAVADTDTFGYGGTLTCVYDQILPAGQSASAFTVTVSVHPDIEVDEILNVASVTSTTRGVKGDDDDEKILVKWLSVGAASECRLDAPWMTYEIDTHNLDTTGETLTVTWRDGSGRVVKTQEIPLDGGPISGALLWPGAEVNADGIGIMWPGWRAALPGETPEFENLVLDSTLPEYGLRAHTDVTFSINPSATTLVEYPDGEAAECADVVREPGLWVKKVASAPVVSAGDTFEYTITAGNDGLGAVSDVVLTDVVPSTLKVLEVTPADAASADVPAWLGCEVTDRLPNGFGGTVTCLLDRPLGYLDPVPAIVLSVQLDPRAVPGAIVNVVTLEGRSTVGQVTLTAQDQAVIMTPGMLAVTGMVIAGVALPIALGFLTLGAILIALRIASQREPRRYRTS